MSEKLGSLNRRENVEAGKVEVDFGGYSTSHR